MSTLPSVSVSPQSQKLKLATLSLVESDETRHLYAVSPRSLPGHAGVKDVHSPVSGILSPTRKSRKGTVDQFSKFLKSFNEQRERTASMLDNYHESKQAFTKTSGTTSAADNTDKEVKELNVFSPSNKNYRILRHTITAASALQSHLQETIKPRKYVPEPRLTAAKAKERQRLGVRLQALGFQLDPCLQSLKQSNNNVTKAADLLLKWYPKGAGGRNMVKRMIGVIAASELKLQEAHNRIHSIMAEGSPEDRLATLVKFFADNDSGNKGYLTPLEFSSLSSHLGIDLSHGELREAIMTLDEDGNGQVELVEYLDWWGDEELAALHANKTGQKSRNKRPSRKARLNPIKTDGKRYSRTLNMPSPTFLGAKKRVKESFGRNTSIFSFGEASVSASADKKVISTTNASTIDGHKITSKEYLEKSAAFLNRQKERKSARINISSQIGMYDNIRAGGWFDEEGNMIAPKTNPQVRKASSSATQKAILPSGQRNKSWANSSENAFESDSSSASPNTREYRRKTAERFARELRMGMEKGRKRIVHTGSDS